MAVKVRFILIIAAVVAVVCLAAGILIGHFVIKKSDKTRDNAQSDTKTGSLSTECEDDDDFTKEHKEYIKKYTTHSAINSCYEPGTCNTFGLPRTYIAYHLNGKTINMDGRLDDEAWEEVPWTELFIDMRGSEYPEPYFTSKVKVRWNDERLYIGAHLQETNFWGTITKDEDPVWYENSFITYIVPDNSMHNYKELQINVLNTTWDLLIKKPYIDNDGQCPEGDSVADSAWSSDQEKKIYTDGVIDDPTQTGTFWSVEWSFSFDALGEHTDRTQPKPNVNESWFMDFLRAEYSVNVVNGSYVKDNDAPIDGWAWQTTDDEDPHFPDKFGLVQFKKDLEDKQFFYSRWHLYKALFEVFIAQKKNRILKREYSMDLYKIGLPPKFLSQQCADVTMVAATRDEFEATAKSRIDTSLPTAHIRQDRYIWFTDN